jgi:hypothetical protein
MEDMMGWPCSFTRTKINLYKVLTGKYERKGPLKRLRRMWEDDIKMNLKEI